MRLHRLALFVVGLAAMVLAGMSLTGHLPRQYHWLVPTLAMVLGAMWMAIGLFERRKPVEPGSSNPA